MIPPLLKFAALSASVLVLGGVSWQQRQTLASLCHEAEALRSTARDEGQLRREQARLERLQISAAELAQLQAARAETIRLKTATAEFRRQTEREIREQAAFESPSTEPPVVHDLTKQPWQNVGQATPSAALQTFLWATVHANTDVLGAAIAFDPAGRALVDALFSRLPDELRARLGSPENAFATLLAVRLGNELGQTDIIGETKEDSGITLQAHLHPPGGKERDAKFHFVQEGTAWRLIVPASIVENYQLMLADPPPPAAK